MFGYVLVSANKLSEEEMNCYRSHYCGLCRSLKQHYGFTGQMTLTFDLTFLSLLLSSLYEPKCEIKCTNCIAHPFKKHEENLNEFSQYAADMSILLTYYKCLDDWEDDRKFKQLFLAKLLKSKSKRLKKLYSEKIEFVRGKLKELSVCEKENETDIDKVSGIFGKIMEEMFVYKHDEWEQTLRRMGFFLGKFIYILDAYEDYEEDIKKNSYNPLKGKYSDESFDEMIEKILTLMMAECARAYEFLPIVENTASLKNIIYSDVWTRYEELLKKKGKSKEQ